MKINGQSRDLNQPTPLADLLRAEGYDPARVAVMVNDRVIPRAELGQTLVQPGDSLEVVSFVGGG